MTMKRFKRLLSVSVLAALLSVPGLLHIDTTVQAKSSYEETEWVPIVHFGAMIQSFKNAVRAPIFMECRDGPGTGDRGISVRFHVQDNQELRIPWRAAWGKRMSDFDKVLSGQGYTMTSRSDVTQKSGQILSCALWHK